MLSLSGRDGAADRRGPLRRLADGIALVTGQADGLAATGRADARPGRDDVASGDDVRMTERFVAICDRTAEKSSLVLVIEDFEEFPETAKEAVRVLARHLLSRSEHPDGRAPARILLVVDHGSEQPDGFLLADASDPRRPIQSLAPLDVGSIRALAAERFGGIDPVLEDLETVQSVTEGLPRLVVSVMAQARDRGDLRYESGVWLWNASSTASYELDRRVSPAATRAIEDLSPAAREVAEYVALLEVPVPEEFLARLCSPEAIAEFAASPISSVSIEGDQTRLAFRSRSTRAHLVSGADTAELQRARDRLVGDRGPEAELVPELARIANSAGEHQVALRLLGGVEHPPSAAWITRAQSAALAALRQSTTVAPAQRDALARLLIPSPIGGEPRRGHPVNDA